MEKVVFISPMYNASSHLKDLIDSIKEQKNPNWEHVIVDDMSTDNSFELANQLADCDKRFKIIKNTEKCYALKNVIREARNYQDSSKVVVAVIDADDALCNENTVDLLLNMYSDDDEVDTIWTAHSWDINSMNISKELPESPPVNPYEYPWCTSHLKTWRGCILKATLHLKHFLDLR